MPSTPERRIERIAHRGLPGERVENTLPGFLLALEYGANAVELDTHVSADGVVVVFHDDAIEGQPLTSLSWDALSRLDLGGGAHIPRLEDVLQAIGDRATVYVELKGRNIEAVVARVVRAHGGRCAMHSFDHAAMERAAAEAPGIPRGVLLDRGVTNPIQLLRKSVERTGARDVWPHWSLVSSDMIGAAAELGARVIPWTVNAADQARHLIEMGVGGICTDDVRILANL